ncbi:MAG: 4-(cytidine 5'-diphospho)-2-C-methyl-D-erythritol kinase [Gemmobacter sp.]|uniref:4-(cytidine 5'-diphospho)-2-C-methyl-D-erythritol kinase n=1 Tax=Gemmobacter sp. TaxID=1898957 RepID=UPI001A462916|nr:4-(cytidine 5'-diphospho)-2-C-methyl-D-erythritol kinase [Gemmobacter sp.]MBL8563084.1 4-(cytidine 5'-diphospho)-2-C-methyl-D-erythritol kinase [Gemmobacter sp.]
MTEFAHAKINLCLHVTGQRADGYHLLDSLVVFAGIGDGLRATPGAELSLTLDGPFAGGVPAGADNLVLRAARLVADQGVALHLTKRLPPASGIGGGSADAAAAIRAVLRLQAMAGRLAPMTPDVAQQIAALGADVPVCLASHPARMRGIGEQLDWLPPLPELHVVLANPRVEVPTPAMFKALIQKDNPSLPEALPHWDSAPALADWLRSTRNDLQAPAMAAQPVIGAVLAALEALPEALFARMSGSGATCFALFAKEDQAQDAAEALRAAHPEWWVAAGLVYPGRADMAQLIRETT